MLNQKIVRGPLSDAENEAILREYNRLTNSRIPMNEFVNWVQHSPAGPAWHALLTTDEGRVVGHTSLFPFTTRSNPGLTPAKSEYSFMHEDFRKEQIRGFEKVARPTFIVLLGNLFQHGAREGWGPIFASTNEKNRVFTRWVGLQPTEYQVAECLFVLRPFNASKHTPNISAKQRAALTAAGMSQRLLWTVSQPILRGMNGVHHVPVWDDGIAGHSDRISFFEDAASLKWRYLDGQYVRFSFKDSAGSYLIAKRGSYDRYLRVCQWRLDDGAPLKSLVVALVREAREENALGVRWALYDRDANSMKLLAQMRGMGFVCAQRPRIVMVHKKDPAFLAPEAWNMNDSMFSFDP
jgi:hypothetical protein